MILWLISRVAGSAVLNQELKYTQLLLSGESCPKVLALVHWKSYYFFPVISPWKPNSEFIFYHSTTPGIVGASRNFLQVTADFDFDWDLQPRFIPIVLLYYASTLQIWEWAAWTHSHTQNPKLGMDSPRMQIPFLELYQGHFFKTCNVLLNTFIEMYFYRLHD